MSSTDRIEKRIVIAASKARVWRALTDTKEFGAWFRAELVGTFEVGKITRGKSTYPGFEHVTMELEVERMDAEELFAFRWHPYAVEAGVDYSAEPTTLVEFRLKHVDGKTELVVTESGFDQIPAHRRAEAFRMNTGGWEAQVENIRSHVTG